MPSMSGVHTACGDCDVMISATPTFTEALDGCEASEVVTNSCEGQGLWT